MLLSLEHSAASGPDPAAGMGTRGVREAERGSPWPGQLPVAGSHRIAQLSIALVTEAVL